MTKYEKAIYDIIQASREHLTAAQIYDALKAQYPSVALATVYNNLNKLWELGLIRKLSVEGSLDRYDRAKKHDHLICQSCGAVLDASFDDLTASLCSQLGSNVLSYDLKVYYLCPACKKKES